MARTKNTDTTPAGPPAAQPVPEASGDALPPKALSSVHNAFAEHIEKVRIAALASTAKNPEPDSSRVARAPATSQYEKLDASLGTNVQANWDKHQARVKEIKVKTKKNPQLMMRAHMAVLNPDSREAAIVRAADARYKEAKMNK